MEISTRFQSISQRFDALWGVSGGFGRSSWKFQNFLRIPSGIPSEFPRGLPCCPCRGAWRVFSIHILWDDCWYGLSSMSCFLFCKMISDQTSLCVAKNRIGVIVTILRGSIFDHCKHNDACANKLTTVFGFILFWRSSFSPLNSSISSSFGLFWPWKLSKVINSCNDKVCVGKWAHTVHWLAAAPLSTGYQNKSFKPSERAPWSSSSTSHIAQSMQDVCQGSVWKTGPRWANKYVCSRVGFAQAHHHTPRGRPSDHPSDDVANLPAHLHATPSSCRPLSHDHDSGCD